MPSIFNGALFIKNCLSDIWPVAGYVIMCGEVGSVDEESDRDSPFISFFRRFFAAAVLQATILNLSFSVTQIIPTGHTEAHEHKQAQNQHVSRHSILR